MRSSSTSLVERAARAAPLLVALVVLALPTVTLLVKGSRALSVDLLVHLLRTVLPAQAAQGAMAAAGAAMVGAALSVGGLGAAIFDFPGRAVLDRALIAPLLLPTWFLAVVYRETFDARGVAWLALALGVGAAPVFDLFGSAALRALPRAYADVLRLGGRGRAGSLVRYLLPLAFPALGAAAALAALLAWADAPSARALAVPTAAVGMLDQWSAREDASAGALLGLAVAAVSLFAGTALLVAVARVPWHDDARLGIARGRRFRLRRGWGAVPWILAAPQIVLGVVVPARAIAAWSAERIERVDLATLGGDAGRSLLLAAAATALAAALALPILHAQAFARRGLATAAAGIALVPFAMPATVLAAAVIWMLPSGGREGPAAILHGTIYPLVMALGVHLTAVFVGAGRAALLRQGPGHVAVLRLTGHSGLPSFVALLRPFLSRPAAAGAALVFLECLKDVPLTVVLSPFGFQSISARVFQYALTERTRDCAVWMLCLALIGVYPLLTLARLGDAGDPVSEPC